MQRLNGSNQQENHGRSTLPRRPAAARDGRSSRFLRAARAGAALVAGALGLGSCGGDTLNNPPPPSDGWVKGQYAAASSFAAQCVIPRTGVDPVTNQAYPDKSGVLLDELNWLRSWTNDLYLWYSEVVDQDPSTFNSDASYFAVLKTTAKTASGNPKDKFHFTYATSYWESLSQSGVTPAYGPVFIVLASSPPRNTVVGYVEPQTPAANLAANLARGTQILAVDGVDLVNANDTSSVATLNAGLNPATVGESHTFSVLDVGATTPRTVTLVSADVTATPVQDVHTIPVANGLVGYLLFNDHLATAEGELVTAFTTLQAAAVTDLVLDIRYNGGGYLDIASEVAYMIAGAAPTAGKTFELTEFNDKHPTVDPVTGATITPVGFHSTTQGFSTTAGAALPSLNLARVFVLTGPSTCSASESIINSLQGVGIEVIQIGSTTCGKPYGFYPQDNCGVTYFSIQFQGVNAKGFGTYPDGFSPQNAPAPQGVPLPGCSVADDFTHALADPAEGRLAAALAYQANGAASCPVASGLGEPATVTQVGYVPPQADGVAVKSVWQQNRIQRRPAAR